QSAKHGLSRDHSRFHRGMVALDLGHIDETSGAADQRAAWKIKLRDRLKTALVERPGAVGDASAALEKGWGCGMRLESLEFLEGAQKRVLVIEANHKTDGHLPTFKMIQKRAAIGGGIERPADRVDDKPRPMSISGHLP